MPRAFLIFALLIIVLIFVLLGALLFGGEKLPLIQTVWALFGANGLNEQQTTILWEIRAPRVLLGASVGAALALAGASYQAILRNPLAEPYLLGVSNGAALGTMFALVFFGNLALMRPLLAFVGAGVSTITVYTLARDRAGMTAERLILSGVIVTTFLSSAIVLITSLLDATRLRSFTFWLLGDLTSAGQESFYIAFGAVAVGLTILILNARSLNLLMLGERDAFDFGVEVGRVRLIVFTTASALVGASVAASGSVGYVGLVVPHWIRLGIGSDNRILLPASAIVGAIFVVVADTIARTIIAPRELPVGAVTALIGAPLFVYLLRKS
jgi:iron complex transport system permease protein